MKRRNYHYRSLNECAGCAKLRPHFKSTPCKGSGGIKGGATGAIATGSPLEGAPRDEIYLFQMKYSFENFRDSEGGSDTRIQLYIIFLRCAKYQGPQQQLISLQVWLSASFGNRYWIAYKYFRFCLMEVYLIHLNFACNYFLIIVLLAWVCMALYSCITPLAQMSRKRYYLRAKASGCRLLVSINQCWHRDQFCQHQIVAFFNIR